VPLGDPGSKWRIATRSRDAPTTTPEQQNRMQACEVLDQVCMQVEGPGAQSIPLRSAEQVAVHDQEDHHRGMTE
jgi:hypothetical protein